MPTKSRVDTIGGEQRAKMSIFLVAALLTLSATAAHGSTLTQDNRVTWYQSTLGRRATPQETNCNEIAKVDFIECVAETVNTFSGMEEFYFKWAVPKGLRNHKVTYEVEFCVLSHPSATGEPTTEQQCTRTAAAKSGILIYMPTATADCRRHFTVQYFVKGCAPGKKAALSLGMAGRHEPMTCQRMGSPALPFFNKLTQWE